MARGDLKSSGGRYRGGSGYANTYDDMGRGRSQNYWEAFEKQFEASGHSCDWLLTRVIDSEVGLLGFDPAGMTDPFLYNLVHNTTFRYNIHDFATRKFEDPDNNDGRCRRLVIDKCGREVWQKLQERAKIVWDKVQKEKEEERQRRAEEEAARRAAFEAERIKREQQARLTARKQAQLTAGALQSDFQHAFETDTRLGLPDGDWLDDPVAAYTSRTGFAREEDKATGIKLQITISIDLSNSMYYNKDRSGKPVYEVASMAFRDLWLALEELKEQYSDDLFIGAFEFSQNTSERVPTRRWNTRLREYQDVYDYRERPGRGVRCLSHSGSFWYLGEHKFDGEIVESGEDSLGAVEKYKFTEAHHFSGEDTWFYPLFQVIEDWEKEFSDPGAVRLDLVLTDAFIEHPSDIRRSDEVQERRDGALQTVFLNFLPEHEWVNSDLPMRCVQYPANYDNLGGLLRTLISNFVSAYV